MKKLIYILLFFSCYLSAQMPDGTRKHDVTEAINIQGGIGIGEGCGIEPIFDAQVYSDLDFQGEHKTLTNTVLTVHGKLKNFGVEISIEEAFAQGLITYNCDESTVIVLNNTLTNTEFEDDTLKAYPNPTNHYINIPARKADVESITITDMSGKTVYSILTPRTDYIKVDVSNFQSGMYIIKFRDSCKKGEILKFIRL